MLWLALCLVFLAPVGATCPANSVSDGQGGCTADVGFYLHTLSSAPAGYETVGDYVKVCDGFYIYAEFDYNEADESVTLYTPGTGGLH